MKFLFFVLFLFSVSCKNDGCEQGAMRCSGSNVQICDSSGNWEKIMDCDDMMLIDGDDDAGDGDAGPGYSCGYDSEIDVYTCIEAGF